MKERFYVMPVEGGEPELDGPFPDFDTLLTAAKLHWAEMNQEMDTIGYLYLNKEGEPSVCYFTNDQMDADDEFNVPCSKCGRTDAELHTCGQCGHCGPKR